MKELVDVPEASLILGVVRKDPPQRCVWGVTAGERPLHGHGLFTLESDGGSI